MDTQLRKEYVEDLNVGGQKTNPNPFQILECIYLFAYLCRGFFFQKEKFLGVLYMWVTRVESLKGRWFVRGRRRVVLICEDVGILGRGKRGHFFQVKKP